MAVTAIQKKFEKPVRLPPRIGNTSWGQGLVSRWWGRHARLEGIMKKVIVVLLLLAGLGGAGGWYYVGGESRPAGFRTAHVERGDLVTTINATGTIEPEEVIDVGAQVAGQILTFGPDPRSGGKLI